MKKLLVHIVIVCAIVYVAFEGIVHEVVHDLYVAKYKVLYMCTACTVHELNTAVVCEQ